MVKPPIRESDPTPLATATITAERMIRAPLGLIVSVLITISGGVVWCTCVWRDVQDLKSDVKGLKSDCAEVKAILREMHASQPIISKNDIYP